MSEPGPGLTVYEKPTCTTCHELFVLLREREVDFERVNYLVEPLSASEIRELLGKAGLRPRDVVRLKEPGARQLPLDDDDAVLAALELHPELLQRPIVVRGDRAVLARPLERVLELLPLPSVRRRRSHPSPRTPWTQDRLGDNAAAGFALHRVGVRSRRRLIDELVIGFAAHSCQAGDRGC